MVFSTLIRRPRLLDALVAIYGVFGLIAVGGLAYYAAEVLRSFMIFPMLPPLFSAETVTESVAFTMRWLIGTAVVLSPAYTYYVVRYTQREPKLRRRYLVWHLVISAVVIIALTVIEVSLEWAAFGPVWFALGAAMLTYAQWATWLYFYLNRRKQVFSKRKSA